MEEQREGIFCLTIRKNKVQEDEEKSYVEMEIQQLLNEFVEIIVGDMPTGMFSMRSIPNESDLVLG